MAQVKPKVTLIGTELASTGMEFIYMGQLQECEGCKVVKACNNLHAGKRYRIVGLRPARHECMVHRNGACAVEVVESPVPALVSQLWAGSMGDQGSPSHKAVTLSCRASSGVYRNISHIPRLTSRISPVAASMIRMAALTASKIAR